MSIIGADGLSNAAIDFLQKLKSEAHNQELQHTMSNEEAIEILSVLRSLYEVCEGDKELKTHEAFSLAINALKSEKITI